MKLNYKRTFLVGFAFFGICAFWQLYEHVVPLILQRTFGFGKDVTGFVMSLDNVLALVMLPLFGMLSDKTNTRWGRRMPYIVCGSFVAAGTMLLIPLAQNIRSLALFIIALGVVLVSMATYRSPAVALMPDVTVKPLRSKANAVINLMGAVGGIIIMGLLSLMLPDAPSAEDVNAVYDPNYFPVFLACAIIIVGATLLLIFFVKEPKLVQKMQEDTLRYNIEDEQEMQQETTGHMARPVVVSMVLLLLSVCFWFMGYNAITTWFSSYFAQHLGVMEGKSALYLMLAQGAAIISYLPVGMLATRIGRRKSILIGVGMLAAAFTFGAFVDAPGAPLYALFVVAGIAWATINVNSYPMVVEMAKGAKVGMFTGFYYTASMLAQVVTPNLSGYLIEHNVLPFFADSWEALFPYGAFFVCLSFITMLFVRHGDAKPVPAASKLETFEAMDT